MNRDLYVWLYAPLAVVIISLCGLLSVAVIPLMQKWFYHTLLQFLVGLAIGSLSADGLLHLMPHAILEGKKKYNNHSHNSVSLESVGETAIWQGFTALAAICIFYIAEHLLGILAAHRGQRNKAKRDDVNSGDVNGKLAQTTEVFNNYLKGDAKEAIQMLQAKAIETKKETTQLNHEVVFHGRSNFKIQSDVILSYNPDSESCVIVSDHHGHSHGHIHETPHSVSAVAWMVIMGDGLHNFCDGLAIGAAFASGIADGVSTSLAVFCHELPHELGDFAMLLKTGMTVKQALCYNGLSSILCFVGMVIGIFLGNVNYATNWIFAFTAGMFLYIAFVDMLPELTSENKSGAAAISILAIQVAGISFGVCIMLLIALYENTLFESIS